MAIQTSKRHSQFIGDGTNKTFTVPFPFLEDAHLKVASTNLSTGVTTIKTITTDYTISGLGIDAEASVTFVTAPTTSERITIYRETPILQPDSLFDNATQTATDIELALDRLTMIAQEQDEALTRAVLQPITQDADPDDPSVLATVTDVFLGKITGAPTGTLHPFAEQRPQTSGIGNEVLPSGRTGSLEFANGSTADKTNTFVVVMQMRDSAGVTAYRSWLPSS